MEKRKITEEELKKILENHKRWLEEDCEDWGNMMADLRRADLSMADLRGAKNVPFLPMTCPDSGSFTAYKKLSEDENSIEFSQRAINDAVRVLFNDTYNKKIGALKMKRTKEMLGK